SIFNHILNVYRTFLFFWCCWYFWILFVYINYVLVTFCYLTVCGIGCLIHSYEVVAVKALFFCCVFFTYWCIVLNFCYIFYDFTICCYILNIYRAFLNFWCYVFFVYINYVLVAFCYLTICRIGCLIHSYEVVTIKALFFCCVCFTYWCIVLNFCYIF